MRLNFFLYNARNFDGYGRFSTRMAAALQRAGVDVFPHFEESANAPAWMHERWGMAWDGLTLSCLPPYYVQKVPGRHWLYTMTEGSECPKGWAKIINEAGIERVLVPCEHNAAVFRDGGINCPVSVIPGGTDPQEFALLTERPQRPYTFLTLADRGERKGWSEVYDAFFMDAGFGPRTEGIQDVRLIIKCRPGGSDLIDLILDKCADIDPRITFLQEDVADMRDLYARADCLVLPSRTEGWGMPHREAAMCGLPVITQAHSGLDDGHTREWAMVVDKGQMQPISDFGKHIKGQWRVVDRGELAGKMRACYERPWVAHQLGQNAARWLRANQTWEIAAGRLIALLQQEGVPSFVGTGLEMEYA